MNKLTEQHIRNAMRLKPDVRVMLGKLDGNGAQPGIAIIAEGFYTYRQFGSFGQNVVMSLQFATGVALGYPNTVTFSLMESEDEVKVRRMQGAVSEFVETLQSEGDHDGAAKIAALLTLTMEDLIRVHDALALGMTRDAFIKALTQAEPVRAADAEEDTDPPSLSHVYLVRMTDDGPVRLYACGPTRPGSKEVQWRVGKARASCYTAEAVEKLIFAYPSITLHTEAAD